MPVRRSAVDTEVELYRLWQSASSEYARVVIMRGSGTPAAREAWERAKVALDDLVFFRSEEFKRQERVA